MQKKERSERMLTNKARRTLRENVDEGIEAARLEQRGKILQKLQAKMIEVDAPQKALTGKKGI